MGDARRAGGSLIDGVAASGANFVGGLIALRLLPAGELAVYALLTTSAILVGLIVQQAVLAPQRSHVNRLTAIYRPSFGRDLLAVAVIAPAIVALVFAGGIALISEIPLADYVALAATCAAWALVFPLFVHVRSAAHVADRSRAAAVSSVLALGVTVLGLVAAYTSSDALPPAFPFAVLVAASAVGIVVCWALLRRVPIAPSRERLTPSVVSGHTTAPVVTEASTYGVMLIAAASLAVGDLASLEVARLAASPLFIVLGAVGVGLLPTALRRFHAGDEQALIPIFRRLVGIGSGVTVVLPLVAFAAAGLLTLILGRTLEPLLGASRVFANGLTGTASYVQTIRLSRRMYGAAARDALLAGAVTIGVMAALVGPIGVFAVPAALSAGAACRLLLGARVAGARS